MYNNKLPSTMGGCSKVSTGLDWRLWAYRHCVLWMPSWGNAVVRMSPCIPLCSSLRDEANRSDGSQGRRLPPAVSLQRHLLTQFGIALAATENCFKGLARSPRAGNEGLVWSCEAVD